MLNQCDSFQRGLKSLDRVVHSWQHLPSCLLRPLALIHESLWRGYPRSKNYQETPLPSVTRGQRRLGNSTNLGTIQNYR